MRRELRYLIGLAFIGFGIYLMAKGLQELYEYFQPISRFMRRLEHLSVARKKEGHLGKQALVLSLPAGSQLVVIGHIHGNDQSLRSIRQDLVRRELLSSEGVLTSGTYMIINGSIFGPTAKNGEVLTALVELMEHNPQGMWLLRGALDRQVPTSFWGSDTLYEHRRILEDFFTTLPLAIYLFADDLADRPLRISPYGPDSTMFERIACYPAQKVGPVKAICRINDLCSYHEGALSGTLDSDAKKITWDTMKGLQHTGSEWHLISSPSREYMQQYGYDISAYAVITLGHALASTTITWYYASQAAEEFVQGKRTSLNPQEP